MNNLTIKQRLMILAVIVLIALSGIFLLFYRTMHINNEQMVVLHDVFELEKKVLELRKHEKDFMARKDLKYKDSFEKVYEDANSLVANIQKFAVEDGVNVEGLTEFDKTLLAYKDVFLRYISSQQIVGLDHKTGLNGSLRKSVHKAEEIGFSFDDDKVVADILMLRRREKDFMLRFDPKYIQSFNKDFAKAIVDIDNSEKISADSKELTKIAMENYKKDFLAYTDEQTAMGLNPKSGILGEMRATVHKTDSQLKMIEESLTMYLNAEMRGAERFMYMVLIASSIVTMVLVIFIGNSILSRIKELNHLMSDLSSGDADLTKQLDFQGRGELVELSGYINKFVRNLRTLFVDIVNSANNIADENTRIAATVEQFNATFSDQASQTASVAAAMEEMSASSANVSDVIGNMESNTNMAKDKVKEGTDMLDKSVGVINEISNKTQQLKDTVTSLANSSNQIGDIINSINDIADQTNLLALNAAIEAARAGEAGRGFAVVADEVRKLAERTQISIKEITDIIVELRSETEKTSQNMEDANQKVEEGVQTMSDTGMVFSELVSIVDDMIAANDTVTMSVSEQVTTVQDVSMNAQAISSGVEESAATVAEISMSTTELSRSAETLKQHLSRFKV